MALASINNLSPFVDLASSSATAIVDAGGKIDNRI
jgi:hypothetical protein